MRVARGRHGTAASADGLCTVTGDNVKARTGPGTAYNLRATTYAGALMYNQGGAWGDNPVDGRWWVYGGLVNGADDVWIRSDLLRCQ
ncbi:hypothetical protein [Kutzneria kofuensis]|uniref:hypothetical protein n=1 Tax=Kutzneria kofuensis TaxID=103725 RepID=UPI0031ED33F4